MNSRIPVTDETHILLRDFARGLGVNMNEAVIFLLSKQFEPGENPIIVGDSLRNEFDEKVEKLKEYEPKAKKR